MAKNKKKDLQLNKEQVSAIKEDIKRKKKTKKGLIISVIIAALLAITAAGLFIWDSVSSHIDFEAADIVDVTLEFGEEYQYPNSEALFKSAILHRNGTPVEVKREGEADFSKLGEYEIKYTAAYKDVTETKTQVIKIVDTTAPVITLVSDPNHFTSPIAKYEEEGFTAIDNYDGDLTASVVSEEKDGVVTYTVADSSGNKTTVTRTIIYKDVVPPKISLSGNSKMYLEVGSSYSEPGYKATDDCDGDITSKVSVKGSVDTKTKGEYVIEYTVKDSYDNTTTVKRTVIVFEKQAQNVKNPGKKVVYLTFDDGPSQYTSKLLDILDKYNVKATFFVTNQYPSYRNMIGEVARRGHTVAVHTYSHKYSEVYASEDAYFKDLQKMSDICVAQTGKTPTIIRFPGGSSNTVSKNYCKGIMTQLTKAVAAKGYLYCDWNVDSNDAGGAKTKEKVASNVISGIKQMSDSKASIVLQHDVYGYSVEAVEEILQWGIANGYTFLPMDETSPMTHHSVNN